MSKQFHFKHVYLAQVLCLNVKTVQFWTIQFTISTYFSSIWHIDKARWGATTPGQSWPGSDSNDGVLQIP